MNNGELFCHLSSAPIGELIRTAKGAVCYAAPGIQREPALAMVEIAGRMAPELATVSLDFDEHVMCMVGTRRMRSSGRPMRKVRMTGIIEWPGTDTGGFVCLSHYIRKGDRCECR